MKTLDSILKVSSNILSVIPKIFDVSLKIILFPWYLSGKGMFRRIENNVYQPTRWFLGTRGPVQKQGTVWNIPWLFKPVEKDGKKIEIPNQPQEVDFRLDYATKDGLGGKLNKCQFTYAIPNESNAKKYYWVGNKQIDNIQEMIYSSITHEIGKREGKNLIGELSDISETVLKNLKTKKSYIQDTYGVEIKNISLSSPDWNNKSQEILSKPFNEQQEAYARTIRAESQAEEARIQADSTRNRASNYIQTGKIYNEAGSSLSVGDIALKLTEFDNLESIAGKPNINTIISTPSPGNSLLIPFPIKNKDYK